MCLRAAAVRTEGGHPACQVGLGKTVQVLGCILARPAPQGWGAATLPATSAGVVPIKATLLVAPAALLPQWEAEVRKHTAEGALRCCTYLGLGAAPAPPPPPPPPAADAEAPSDDAEGGRRSKRARSSVTRYTEPPPVSRRQRQRAGSEPAESEECAEPAEVHTEVLAATRVGLFVAPDGSSAAVAECDLVLCSFETLRDELKHGRARGGAAGPSAPRGGGGGSGGGGGGDGGLALGSSLLAMLGFWRIVLDEAQVVSNTNSAAALMASALWRRHAWVVTGTPVNAKLSELQGLLAFLDVRPFADPQAFHLL